MALGWRQGEGRVFRWLAVLLGLGVVTVSGFLAWAVIIPPPMDEALAAVESDTEVRVGGDPWLVFEPGASTADVGFVLYPGGRVDPRAYAPAARAIAERGYLVAIVPMPLNLAVLAPDRAGDVMAAHPEIAMWAVGGHSLGGSMAARFVGLYPEHVGGLVLWASYPAASQDLSEQALLTVVSIYGTRDGLATPEDVLASRPLLPVSTRWVPIEGGNHAQFGWYGPQRGDDAATISRAVQQAQVVEATVAVLRALEDAMAGHGELAGSRELGRSVER